MVCEELTVLLFFFKRAEFTGLARCYQRVAIATSHDMSFQSFNDTSIVLEKKNEIASLSLSCISYCSIR